MPIIPRDCSEFLVGGVVLSGRSARKKCTPPLGVSVKFWYPPPLEFLSKMGTPPRMPEAFQGSTGESRERGIQGGGGNCTKGVFCYVLFRFLCV